MITEYLNADKAVRRTPLSGQMQMLVANLRDIGKWQLGNSSANRCDTDSSEYQSLPPKDRRLLDAVSSCNAYYLVTKDPHIARGPMSVPMRGGGRLQLEVIEPTQVVDRIESR